jgi:hypothetical protein
VTDTVTEALTEALTEAFTEALTEAAPGTLAEAVDGAPAARGLEGSKP